MSGLGGTNSKIESVLEVNMAGIWITVDEAQEIFDHFDGHYNDLVEPDGIRGMLFQSGQKLFLLRYLDVGNQGPIFDNPALEYDEETDEVFCQEMESYQSVEKHKITKFRPKRSHKRRSA